MRGDESRAGHCTLADFIAATKDAIPVDWHAECGFSLGDKISDTGKMTFILVYLSWRCHKY